MRLRMSEMSGVSNCRNSSTRLADGRSMSRRTRKPGPGVISADFGRATAVLSTGGFAVVAGTGRMGTYDNKVKTESAAVPAASVPKLNEP
jgi:hypothetical protein